MSEIQIVKCAVNAGADLTPFRDDIWAVLSSAPAEVPALLAAVRDGRIDGTCYEGACACLVGTIANARGCEYNAVPGLVPNSQRMAETWFWNITPGDTPASNIYAQYAEQWIAEWLERIQHAFGAPAQPSADSGLENGRSER